MQSLRPEGALRLLDAADGWAYALRLACIGYWGARLRFAFVALGIGGLLLVQAPV